LVRAKRALIEKTKKQPCMDCGHRFPAVCMDFDHVRGPAKKYTISSAYRCISMDRLKEEIAKCDVVCSNCHRIRTAARPHQQRGRPVTVLAKVGGELIELKLHRGSADIHTERAA
jgi:hypothetical protein